MSQAFEIPLQPINQSFNISLAGKTYILRVFWCEPNASWVLNIADSSGKALLSGIPLVTGSDLLSPFPYAGIGGRLYVATDNSPAEAPGKTSLGVSGHLYFVPNSAP